MIRAAVALSVTAFATAVLFQAPPRALTLRPADATLGEPFTSIYSIRELADGRVLISDYSSDNRVVVADLVSGGVRRVGNVGAGPREYRQAGKLFALPGDSTLLIDSPERGRWWLLMHHDSIVANGPPDLPALRIVGGSPSGVDSRGRVLGVRQAGSEKLSHNMIRERLLAVVGSRSSSRADTVAALRGSEYTISQVGTRQRPFWVQRGLTGSASEQAVLFPDGWIATARLEPYRIEWLPPGRAPVRGPDILWEQPRADAREKAAALERHKRRNGDKNLKDVAEYPWADRLAPIRNNALLGTPEGNLLVLRAQWSQAMDTNYDLFDRTGRRIGTIALPDSERIVGFGSRSAYVSVRDGDGFHRLRRHPWPNGTP
jgi:hypothetical protein